ncbi:MAG: sulfotransferase domain-containing protein [Cyanobacteria bacterium P01_F01_bin.150]
MKTSSLFKDVKSYFDRNKSEGNSFLGALFSVPYKAYKKKVRGGDVIYGYSMYDKPLVVSYSRSGMNWLRYSMEYLTNIPTPGCKRLLGQTYGDILESSQKEALDYKKSFLFDRAHKGYTRASRYPVLVLLLRNYKECLIRQNPEEWENSANVIDFLESTTSLQPPFWYIENIKAFDQFSDNKFLIYYEDMISNPIQTFGQFIDFLGISYSDEKLKEFESNLAFHRKASVGLYETNQESLTGGEAGKLLHHSRKLSSSERIGFDEYYRDNHLHLYRKYLKRYSE